MAKKLGLLAYGSLVGEPGSEIEAVTREVIRDIYTPFNVEFARLSDSRSGAPTLIPVPVTDGGAQVAAVIFVIDTTIEAAEHMLWRRETRKTGEYERSDEPGTNKVVITRRANFVEVETVLYTSIGSNILPIHRNATFLAKAAIASAEKRKDGKDGISYLRNALSNGVETPLSASYEAEILKLLGVESLEAALTKLEIPFPE